MNGFFHILSSAQFDREQLDYLCNLSTKIKEISKTKEGILFLQNLLLHKQAMFYFTQPSTRTFLSFYSACQKLGIKVAEVRDKDTSSEYKGETYADSIRTFSSYFDMIIMRSEEKKLARRMANLFDSINRSVPIINGGSGKDDHPTQALLDIYTLHRSFEKLSGVDGKKITFVGDLKRGRTVRSVITLLSLYKGIHIKLIAPKHLQLERDTIRDADVSLEMSDDFEYGLKDADAVYMTRIQDEWDVNGESDKMDISKFSFKKEHLNIIKDSTIIMHPFPRRHEISPDIDHDPRAVYWRQMRNGLWIRVALIASIFNVDESIINAYDYYVRGINAGK